MIHPSNSFKKRKAKDKINQKFKLFSSLELLAKTYFDGFQIGEDLEQYDRKFEKKHLICKNENKGWKV